MQQHNFILKVYRPAFSERSTTSNSVMLMVLLRVSYVRNNSQKVVVHGEDYKQRDLMARRMDSASLLRSFHVPFHAFEVFRVTFKAVQRVLYMQENENVR